MEGGIMMNEKDMIIPESLSVIELQKFIDEGNNDFSNNDPEQPAVSDLEILLQTQEKLRQYKSQKIVFSKPILWQNGLPVIFPKTINVIQGKKGQHKSRLAENICSALLRREGYQKDILGFEADTSRNYTVCLVDTERNLSEQFSYSIQQILIRAGYTIEDNPSTFEYTSLIEIERPRRFNALSHFIENMRSKHNNHLFIVLDVLTDCIDNFNDPKDSLKLIDLKNKIINQHDVTFLIIIHENPNGDKARGHLGTEIINKASTVMQVAYVKDANQNNTDLIKVSYLHCRSTRIHEPFYVRYSDEEGGLVLAEPVEINETLDTKNFKIKLSDVASYLQLNLKDSLDRQTLIDDMVESLDASARSIEYRLKELIEQNHIFTIDDNEYCLKKSKTGKNTYYCFQFIKDVSEEPF